jgi:hypothetical protein
MTLWFTIPLCILAAFAIAFGVLLIFRLFWGDDDDYDTYADYCNQQDEMK